VFSCEKHDEYSLANGGFIQTKRNWHKTLTRYPLSGGFFYEILRITDIPVPENGLLYVEEDCFAE